MKILAIETSCDETAAAVVENGTVVLSNVVASQIPLHQKTGGVVPEVAAREHVLKISPVISEALEVAFGKTKTSPKPASTSARAMSPARRSISAHAATLARRSTSTRVMAPSNHPAALNLSSIDAIAVTRGPGLLSSLIIGTTAASTLATFYNKPLIPVNHIAGHIYANWLDQNPDDPIQFPVLVLTVSGGHNELVLMRSHADFELLGETLDDAAGEAFDKVSRLLGLGYPGGPAISKAAEKGNRDAIKFPRAYLNKNSFDFSFSGLKTAVLNQVMIQRKNTGENITLDQNFINDCAASFQESVCQILSDKLLHAAYKYHAQEVHLAGGVSANQRLRELVSQKISTGSRPAPGAGQLPVPRLRYPNKIAYCTDNAAMIAAAAFFHYQKNPRPYLVPSPILADPGLNLYTSR